MNLVLIGVMFVTVVGGFSLYGLADWWVPRHRLNVIFAERRRERVAVARILTPPVVVPRLKAVN